jgi:hypothetical protein
LEDQDSRDVAITPDGSFALVRHDGSSSITVVGLADGVRTEVVFEGEVTDLDLAPDGSRALAVVREKGQVSILPIPAIAQQPTIFETVEVQDVVVGSAAMASDANVALLYSNASDQHRIASLHYDAMPARVDALKLHSPVMAVYLSANGAESIVLHRPTGSADQSEYVGAFSMLRLDSNLPARIVGMKAPPMAVAFLPSGSHAVVAERDDVTQTYGVHLARMENQQVDRYTLGSPPISVGIMAQAHRAFVAQEHPEGRLTFIDLESGLVRTLTGFELGARVVDGSAD